MDHLVNSVGGRERGGEGEGKWVVFSRKWGEGRRGVLFSREGEAGNEGGAVVLANCHSLIHNG